MRIISRARRGDNSIVVHVRIKSGGRRDFVYPADKFKNLSSLKREIRKKIVEIDRRKERLVEKRNAVETEIDAELAAGVD